MKTRYISEKNFDRLTAKFKPKIRKTTDTHGRHPFETKEEHEERLRHLEEDRPISLVYHGRYHMIEFKPK